MRLSSGHGYPTQQNRSWPAVFGRTGIACCSICDESYLGRDNAIPIYEPELPLTNGAIKPIDGMVMASSIRDGSPDAWGRRAIIKGHPAETSKAVGILEISELKFLLASGSDRIGSLNFQASSTAYVPCLPGQTSLAEIMEAAALFDKGAALPAVHDQAIRYRTSIGGARPKALIDDGTKKLERVRRQVI